MASTDLGRLAEDKACTYLEAAGHRIITRNWHNRWCELDIVSSQGGIVHIVEVKYRSNTDYGSGFEYITAYKLDRLSRAASIFMTKQRLDYPYQIDVVAVSGDLTRPVIESLENVTA